MKRKPIVTVQFPDGSARRLRDHFHRSEASSGSADDLHAALDQIISDPKGTLRGVVQKRTFKRAPTRKPDEEQLPGVAVDAAVEQAFAT